MKEIQSGKAQLYSQCPNAVFDVMKYAFTVIGYDVRLKGSARH